MYIRFLTWLVIFSRFYIHKERVQLYLGESICVTLQVGMIRMY